jgi:hypothetical protein
LKVVVDAGAGVLRETRQREAVWNLGEMAGNKRASPRLRDRHNEMIRAVVFISGPNFLDTGHILEGWGPRSGHKEVRGSVRRTRRSEPGTVRHHQVEVLFGVGHIDGSMSRGPDVVIQVLFFSVIGPRNSASVIDSSSGLK